MSGDDPNGGERDGAEGDDGDPDSSLDDLLRTVSEQTDDDGEEVDESGELADFVEEKEGADGTSLDDLLGEVETDERSDGEEVESPVEGSSLDDLLEEVNPDHRSGEAEKPDDIPVDEGSGTEPSPDDFSGQAKPRQQTDEGKGAETSVGEGTTGESSFDDLLGEVGTDERSRSEQGGRSDSGGEGGIDLDTRDTGPAHPKIDPETIQDASDILVLEPAGASDLDNTCVPFFTTGSPDRRNALFVSLTGSVDDTVDVLQRTGSRLPANVGVIGVNETARSTVQAALAEYGLNDVTVNVVSDPSDLTRLGLSISKIISSWEDSSARPTVCFRSLTALLQYVEPESVFRFLHVLRGRFSAVDAIAHYHMDADAHDQQTIATLRTLFDTVIEVTPDGEFEATRE